MQDQFTEHTGTRIVSCTDRDRLVENMPYHTDTQGFVYYDLDVLVRIEAFFALFPAETSVDYRDLLTESTTHDG